MKLQKWLIVGLTVIPLTLFGVPGCKDDGPFEEAGEAMEDAADDIGDGLEDLGDDIKREFD